MRVPGSVHPAAKTWPRVKYWFQAGNGGQAYTYTLEELARLFSVPSPELAREEREAMAEAERPTGKRWRGFAQLNARRLREFRVLRAMRGGFAQGCRNYAALIYAWLLRCNRVPPEVIAREVEALAAECRPALSLVEARQAVKSALGGKLVRIRDRRISDWLKVTAAEAIYLEKLPAASTFGKADRDLVRAESGPEERHRIIRDLIRERGAAPSTREMSRLLRERQIEVSHMQVARDFKALGIGL